MKLTFRTKMFIALLGLIIPLLAIVLFAVNYQTGKQVELFTNRSIARARSAFTDAEKSNRGRLEGLGQRFAATSRISALVQASLMSLDTAFVASTLNYDLKFSGEDSALVAFTDLQGHPIAGVLRMAALRDPVAAVPAPLIDSMLVRGDTAGFAYQLIDNRLYSVYAALVRVVSQPIGFLIVGRPIDQNMAQSIGQAVEGEVCFVAANQCVASTAALYGTGLSERDMVEATRLTGPVARKRTAQNTLKRNGKHWLVLADPLAGGTGWRVIARPLDEVLKPFEDIRSVLLRIVVLALLLAPIFAIIFARSLARPIRALVAATARIAHGDFSVHVPVTSNDELGMLSSAFNDMTNGLQLKETYRGLLDKVISPEIADEMLKSDISLGGENREVTIVFADIRGFTSFTEDMEPQDVILALNEAMEHASAVVEREGGVVDKYMGDEIMALFGAPLSHENDALRAVHAAIGIRDAIEGLSAERIARGERALTIGIGVNTGVVVAGNMGSDRRLNYTVLGQAVNVAARLCSDAKAQEILIGEATCVHVRDCVDMEPPVLRQLRGLSQPLSTYAVRRIREAVPPQCDVDLDEIGASHRDAPVANAHQPASGAKLPLVVLLLAAALALAAAPRNTLAQRTPLASYSTSSGDFQATLGGRADLTLFAPGGARAWLIHDVKTFAAPHVSVFGEAFGGAATYALAELRVDRGEAPAAGPMQVRIEQVFARYSRGPVLALQAGKFVSPFGSYPQRHGTDSDPFIRPPLLYEWPTMVTPGVRPDDTNDFLDWKLDPATFRPLGVPPVWGIPYQIGAMAFGTSTNTSYRVAVMNSAPSSIPSEWNSVRNLWRRPSFVASLSQNLSPDLHAGLSFNRGPYMREHLLFGAYLPTESPDEFNQSIVGADATYARDHIEMRGEVFYDRWHVPDVVGRPADFSWYVESKAKLMPGLFIAGRFARITYNNLIRTPAAPAAPKDESWDYPVSRIQLGAGYQITPTLSLRSEYQWTRLAQPQPARGHLLSFQLRIDP